jgi:hypothetical protein
MKNKKIFGIVNKGVHKYKIFNIAIFDLLFTLLSALIISFYIKKSFITIFILLFLISIIVHRIYGIRTTVDKLLFHKNNLIIQNKINYFCYNKP